MIQIIVFKTLKKNGVNKINFKKCNPALSTGKKVTQTKMSHIITDIPLSQRKGTDTILCFQIYQFNNGNSSS